MAAKQLLSELSKAAISFTRVGEGQRGGLDCHLSRSGAVTCAAAFIPSDDCADAAERASACPDLAGAAVASNAAGGRRLATRRIRPLFTSSAGVWHKPVISAKNFARLRREALLAGEHWPHDKPAKEVKRRKSKGHKHDREKPLRCVPCSQ